MSLSLSLTQAQGSVHTVTVLMGNAFYYCICNEAARAAAEGDDIKWQQCVQWRETEI